MSDTGHMTIKQIHDKNPVTSSPGLHLGCWRVPALAPLSPWKQMDVTVPSPSVMPGQAGRRQMATEGKGVQILLSGRNCRNP